MRQSYLANVFVSSLFLALLSSCGGKEKALESSELARSASSTSNIQRPVITTSEANTDLASVANIARPATSKVVGSQFPLENLYGIWTYDPEGPHADFDLNEKWFYVVDYDGNGEMPYLIQQDSIIVYYNDFIARGHIKEATGESLKISWDGQEATGYVRWTQ